MSHPASHRIFNAIFLIAISALSPWAIAQNSYKCGSNYSQTPCPDAVPVTTDDSRSNVQRKQADASTARIARTADVMEKDRLAQEKKDLAANRVGAMTADKPVSSADAPAKAGTKKKKNAPEYFTAQVPGEKKAKKKTVKEKASKAVGTAKAKKETASKS